MPPNRLEKTRIETNRACPSCQKNNPDMSKFCNHCGGRLEAICRACGQTNPIAANFCNSCGQLLDGDQKKPTLNRDHSRSYPMDAKKSKTRSNHNIVQGERKRVTVLFADTVNYTAMSETLDPEEVHGIMDGCSRILTDQVQRFDGKVNQFTGDGIMALFGAPLAQEDHAQKACYAALAVQEALVGYSKSLNKRLGINFNMRIGLNSGLVIVGGVGSDQQMDYTAIGDTVNLASRMEGLAKPGSIWVSENTHQLAREYFVFDYLGKFQVKGKVASQKSYRLIKTKHVNSRLDAAAFRGFTPYTGRKEELALLEEAFAVSQVGKGQVVGISGEPGAGKSRLAHELKSRIGPNGVVAEGRCVLFGGAIAFLPLRDILRELFGVGRTEHPRKALLKITANLKRLDLETEEHQAVCQDLLALPVSSETWQNMPPKKRKEKTFKVLREIFFRLADIRPLILIIDDLHWMDKTSEEFYDDIIDKIESVPILLLLLYRPEYRHTWAERSHYRHIILDQLQSDISEKFIRSILIDANVVDANVVDANVDGANVTAELTRFIAARSSGNPLFMEELTRTLLAKAAIKFENDGYVLDEDIASKHIPENIYGIIASRIDRLDDNHKQVIQTASVIGRDFTYRIINALLDFEVDLKGHLKVLQDLKLIYPIPGSPEQAYLFKHVLIQEVAYNSLLRQKRSRLHEQIAVAIETLYPERIEEFYEVLAHHYEKSDNVDKAYEYLRISGEKASRTHFLWEAYDFFKRASKVLDRGAALRISSGENLRCFI